MGIIPRADRGDAKESEEAVNVRPLLIGPEQREDIQRVIVHAERNRIPRAELELLNRRMKEGDSTTVGDDVQLRCEIPFGFRVVFSIEEQHGWCRHISISVDAPGKVPNENAVCAITAEFGFKGTLDQWIANGGIWVERDVAINVLEPLDWKA